MRDDDNDGQVIFGDLGGLKLTDICVTGEQKPRKTSPRKPVPTGDRTRARCVTGAQAAAWYTAVDLQISLPHKGSLPTKTRNRCFGINGFVYGSSEVLYLFYRNTLPQNSWKLLLNFSCRWPLSRCHEFNKAFSKDFWPTSRTRDHGRLARWRKWRPCDIKETEERL